MHRQSRAGRSSGFVNECALYFFRENAEAYSVASFLLCFAKEAKKGARRWSPLRDTLRYSPTPSGRVSQAAQAMLTRGQK